MLLVLKFRWTQSLSSYSLCLASGKWTVEIVVPVVMEMFKWVHEKFTLHYSLILPPVGEKMLLHQMHTFLFLKFILKIILQFINLIPFYFRTLVSVWENGWSKSSEIFVWSNRPSVRLLRCAWRWSAGSMTRKELRYGSAYRWLLRRGFHSS